MTVSRTDWIRCFRFSRKRTSFTNGLLFCYPSFTFLFLFLAWIFFLLLYNHRFRRLRSFLRNPRFIFQTTFRFISFLLPSFRILTTRVFWWSICVTFLSSLVCPLCQNSAFACGRILARRVVSKLATIFFASMFETRP